MIAQELKKGDKFTYFGARFKVAKVEETPFGKGYHLIGLTDENKMCRSYWIPPKGYDLFSAGEMITPKAEKWKSA